MLAGRLHLKLYLGGSPDTKVCQPVYADCHPAKPSDCDILGAQLPAIASALQPGVHEMWEARQPLLVTQRWKQLTSHMPLIPVE